MKKCNKTIAIFLVILLSVSSFVAEGLFSKSLNAQAAANISYKVKADTLVRSGAGTGYSVLGKVKKGQKLSVLNEKFKGWYQIEFKEKKAYVNRKYVQSYRTSSSTSKKSPEFTNIKSVDSSIVVDLRYNTTNNFTGKRIYNFSQAILRKSTAKKLASANASLKRQGYKIKIWDSYRPLYAQQALWNAYPNPTFVAKPNLNRLTGHQLGATVDVTLCTLDGKEIPMQSKFDDFSSRAFRSYSRTSEQEKHYQILVKSMSQAGFKGYDKEWWHYSDINQKFKPIQTNPTLY